MDVRVAGVSEPFFVCPRVAFFFVCFFRAVRNEARGETAGRPNGPAGFALCGERESAGRRGRVGHAMLDTALLFVLFV